jgi:hypothetical protein
MAFIEGMAVAADWPAGEATVHQATAAMRQQGRLPDLLALFAPGRFYAEAGPRAYTAAGSLIRFLWEQRGPAALRAAYGSPLGLGALGPLPPLLAAHAAFLDGVSVPEAVLAQAALRLAQPSILRRRCPHEVAEVEAAAAAAAAAGDQAGAARLWERCAALEPDDPALLLLQRRAEARAKDAVGAAAALARLLAHPKLSQPQRAQLLSERGDEAWGRGDAASAAAAYAEALLLPQTDPQLRALQARRYALAEPRRWPAVRRLLVDLDTGPETWLLLRDLDLAEPASGFAAYLLARQASNQGAWQSCLRFGGEALRRELPGPLFRTEALRLRASCGPRAGDEAAARAALDELAADPSEARRLEAERALRRLPPPAPLQKQ